VRLVQGSGTLIMTLVPLQPNQLAAGQEQRNGGGSRVLAAGPAISVGHYGITKKWPSRRIKRLITCFIRGLEYLLQPA